MDRIHSAKRKRESPDEDELAEAKEMVEMARSIVNQVQYACRPSRPTHLCMQPFLDFTLLIDVAMLEGWSWSAFGKKH